MVAVGRGRGLGKAVTLNVRQPGELKESGGHGLGHGRPAASDISQAFQAVALEIGAGEEVNNHGGNIGPVGHLMAVNQESGPIHGPSGS